MITKKVAAIAAAAVLAVGVGAYGMASAYGGHGHFHGHAHGGLFLLAKAAGISHSDIKAAFQNDATKLQNDHAALKTARENFVNCLLSSSNTSATSCGSQASALLTAKQTAETDKLALWEGLFASAPNKANAANVLSQLQALRAQRKQIFQQAFGGGSTGSAASSDTPATTNQ